MTAGVLLAARLALAAVFAAAGAAKLLDRAGSRRAMLDFGVPERLAGGVALVLPVAELAVAGALLPAGSASVAAGAALALLVAFVFAVARSMARGEAPDCHCFGQISSRPAGPATLARNAGLAILAGVLLVDGPGPSAVAWVGRLHGTSLVAVCCAAAVLALLASVAWLVTTMMRAHGRLLLRVDELERRLAAPADYEDMEVWTGLALGEPAPEFETAATDDGSYALSDLLDPAAPMLLVFTNPQCGPCREVMPEVAEWRADHPAGAPVVEVVSSGEPTEVVDEAGRTGLDRVLLDPDRAVAEAYEVRGTPAAIVISADGAIASDVAYGADGLRELHARFGPFALDVVAAQPAG